jgi:cation diffusion facilitator CzcD-associated flavoprotein CzcO
MVIANSFDGLAIDPLTSWCRNIRVLNVKTCETFQDTANILVSARGGLNQVSWPDIKGLKDFGGKLMHSGAWDER